MIDSLGTLSMLMYYFRDTNVLLIFITEVTNVNHRQKAIYMQPSVENLLRLSSQYQAIYITV